ncbi:hypothetical protein BH09ACT8_BH09ACT8_37980 [soil metagenome]
MATITNMGCYAEIAFTAFTAFTAFLDGLAAVDP